MEARKAEDAVLSCYRRHRGNYGRPRIHRELQRKGFEISSGRVGRILHKYDLQAKAGRHRKARKAREIQCLEENLVADKFAVTAANALWCSDITELRCKQGKLYVCGVIDVATRRIVGWSVGQEQRQQLVQKAFAMAVGRNPERPEGAVYHSDRGSQYTARSTKSLVESNGFQKSMSRPGTPHDNQPIESFWHTMEVELGSLASLSYAEAALKIIEYIELYYNADRIHSGIQYCTPNEKFSLLSFHTF